MIWVYAICDRPELGVPPVGGLAGAPLEAVREGDLLAVVSRHAEPLGDPTPDTLWAHEEVVERLVGDRTVLPMRFGSHMDSDEELRAFVASEGASLHAALERVRGRDELGVRVAEREPAPVPAATGRDYVAAKLGRSRRAESVHAPLAALAADVRRLPVRGEGELLRAAYLVDRDAVPHVRDAVDRLRAEQPDLAIVCTGPWPAYSFVADPQEAEAA